MYALAKFPAELKPFSILSMGLRILVLLLPAGLLLLGSWRTTGDAHNLPWLWLGAAHLDDWYPHLAQAVLLVVPLLVFASQTLTNSGAPALRRARLLAQRLADRKDWPADLTACRSLPEVKALREALHVDAT